jgi:hypothetical protein
MTVITHLTGAALHVWACSSLFVKAISEPNLNEIERTSEGAQMYLKMKRKLRRSLFALRMLAEKIGVDAMKIATASSSVMPCSRRKLQTTCVL